MRITQNQADQFLLDDLSGFESCIQELVKTDLTSCQFSALCSFTYNLGPEALRKSTLLKKINVGDFKSAANEFLKWSKAGGKTLPGLVRRRKAEKDLFLSEGE